MRRWTSAGIFTEHARLNLPDAHDIPNLATAPNVDLADNGVQGRLRDRTTPPWDNETWWDQIRQNALDSLNQANANPQPQPNQGRDPSAQPQPDHQPQPNPQSIAHPRASPQPPPHPHHPSPHPAPQPHHFTLTMRGSLARINAVLSSARLPPHRKYVFQNLRAAMDAHGVTWFRAEYPSSTGGIPGGRATFKDTNNRGNTFLTCPDVARAYIYGDLYDEIDISRSHFSSLLGCFSLTGRSRPPTMLRYQNEPAALEGDVLWHLR